jgi:hypothetical protein
MTGATATLVLRLKDALWMIVGGFGFQISTYSSSGVPALHDSRAAKSWRFLK